MYSGSVIIEGDMLIFIDDIILPLYKRYVANVTLRNTAGVFEAVPLRFSM